MNVTIGGFEKSWCGSDKGTLVRPVGWDKWEVKIVGGKHDQEIFVLPSVALVGTEE